VDDKGVVHISKKPPPQSAELIDIMDYKNHTASPPKQKQADQKQQKDLNRTDAGESGKASDKKGADEDIEDDVYYDSRGDRYTRKKRKHEKREQRHEDSEGREKRVDSDPDKKDRYREDHQEEKDSPKTEKSERQDYLKQRKESNSPGRK